MALNPESDYLIDKSTISSNLLSHLQIRSKSVTFALIKGVPYFQAEIKPYEPDAGNAAVGIYS